MDKFVVMLGVWVAWAVLGGGAVPAAGAAQKLNVFIWSEYLPPEVVKDFERRHDAEVVLDLFEDTEGMLAKMQGGGSAVYDIVVPPDHAVPVMVKLGLLAELRHERIPNLKNLEERFRRLPFDPGNRHTVAYQWGTLGLYYRKEAGKPAPDTWAAIFDAKRQPGPMVLLDSMRDTVGAALKHLGHGFNTTDLRALRAARELLLDAKKRSLAFDGSVGGKNRVLNRSASVAMVYSGEAMRGITEDPETAYVIPKEGSEVFVDTLAVPARAPHRDLAEAFINFVLEPEVGARISNHTRFGSPNAAARRHLRASDAADPGIYPPAEVVSKLEYLDDLGAKTRVYDELWSQVKGR
jgi:spermidine/putrescine transport system substrate-binding protein